MAQPRRAWPRFWRDRRGVAALEMAAVAPILILLLMICVDFGRAISQSIELNHAVKAGAQYAIAAANAQAQIEATISRLRKNVHSPQRLAFVAAGRTPRSVCQARFSAAC